MKKTKQPYYIKYLQITGLGQTKFQEWFKTKAEQIRQTKRIQAAGYELTGFGRVGV